MPSISVAPYPDLAVRSFGSAFPAPLGEMSSPDWLIKLLSLDTETPFTPTDEVRAAVRDLFRARGYKPTGRGKPAAEYLVRAATEGTLPSINLAVDLCNVVSLHSGIPISLVDLDLARDPFRVDVPEAGSDYIFNATGQSLKLDGLLCLIDAEGPCANAVKDSQRTKTHDGTNRTLTVMWGTERLDDRTERAEKWYRELCERAGASTTSAELTEKP
ncbi:hypothetical protein BH23BAC4_BH23BAC4_17520 [soil metagenome]